MDQSKKIFGIFVSAFLLGFTLFLLYTSFTTASLIAVEGLTSMDFPRAIFYFQIVLCVFVLVNSIRTFVQAKRDKAVPEEEQTPKTLIDRKVLISLILVIAYVILWDIIGYLLSTFLFFTVESRMLDNEKALWKCALIGLIVAGFSYTVFGILFQVSFPEPLLQLIFG